VTIPVQNTTTYTKDEAYPKYKMKPCTGYVHPRQMSAIEGLASPSLSTGDDEEVLLDEPFKA